jgi:hypothetical protein
MENMAKKRYSEDYEIIYTIDEKGKEKQSTVYRGDYYEVALDNEGLVKFKWNSFLVLAIIIVLHIIAGFINNPGLNHFYVIFPYIFAIFPIWYLGDSIFRLPNEKRKFRRKEIGLSFDRIKASSNILLFLLAIGIISELIFLIFASGGEFFGLEFLYLALELIISGAVYYQIILHRQISIQITTKS